MHYRILKKVIHIELSPVDFKNPKPNTTLNLTTFFLLFPFR